MAKVKVKVCYLNNDVKDHEPTEANIVDGHLVMDWPSKRVFINTLNLAWIEVDNS